MKKIILSGSLLLMAMAAVQMTTQAQKTAPAGGVQYTLHPGEAGGPATEYVDITRDGKNGKSYRMVRVGNKIKEFYVDGRRIPNDSIVNYRSVIKDIEEEIRLTRQQSEQDRADAGRDQEEAKRDIEEAKRDQEESKKDLEEAKRDQEEVKREQEEIKRDQEETKRDQEEAESNQDEVKRNQVDAQEDRRQALLDQKQEQADREQAEKDKLQLEKDRIQSEKDRIQSERDQVQSDKDRIQSEKDHAFYEQQLRDLVADLVKDHILKIKTELTGMGLSDQLMTVNGQRVSAAIHERYKKKYLREAGMGLYYGKVILGNGIYFEKKDLKDL